MDCDHPFNHILYLSVSLARTSITRWMYESVSRTWLQRSKLQEFWKQFSHTYFCLGANFLVGGLIEPNVWVNVHRVALSHAKVAFIPALLKEVVRILAQAGICGILLYQSFVKFWSCSPTTPSSSPSHGWLKHYKAYKLNSKIHNKYTTSYDQPTRSKG